jgi:hypothetical protein
MTSTETTTAPSPDPEVAFESERLQGRRLQPAHLGAMLAVYGDPEVTRWAGDGQPLGTPRSAHAGSKLCECLVGPFRFGLVAVGLADQRLGVIGDEQRGDAASSGSPAR